jgi:hypothetical protein
MIGFRRRRRSWPDYTANNPRRHITIDPSIPSLLKRIGWLDYSAFAARSAAFVKSKDGRHVRFSILPLDLRFSFRLIGRLLAL